MEVAVSVPSAIFKTERFYDLTGFNNVPCFDSYLSAVPTHFTQSRRRRMLLAPPPLAILYLAFFYEVVTQLQKLFFHRICRQVDIEHDHLPISLCLENRS